MSCISCSFGYVMLCPVFSLIICCSISVIVLWLVRISENVEVVKPAVFFIIK